MIMNAVAELEAAIPVDTELLIGSMPAYADDILSGLRHFARQM
jgi:CO dehydrogenase/acetyl-CoA synthase epsilon subunit